MAITTGLGASVKIGLLDATVTLIGTCALAASAMKTVATPAAAPVIVNVLLPATKATGATPALALITV